MDKELILAKTKQPKKNGLYICPICGKSFYVTNRNYIYKKKNKEGFTRWACSYSCSNKLGEVIEESKHNYYWLKNY